MTNLTIRDVETAKAAGNYRLAGQMQAMLGYDTAAYGCHFGMRSTRELAMAAFRVGYNEAHFYLTHGDRDPINGDFTSAPFSPFAR